MEQMQYNRKRSLGTTGSYLDGVKFHVRTLAVCKGFLVLMSTGWVRSCIRPLVATDGRWP
jgi:hypothetical protein